MWRLHYGKWKCLIQRTDRGGHTSSMRENRVHVATERGIWLAAGGPALWFVHRNDEPPVPIDWNRNVKAARSDQYSSYQMEN